MKLLLLVSLTLFVLLAPTHTRAEDVLLSPAHSTLDGVGSRALLACLPSPLTNTSWIWFPEGRANETASPEPRFFRKTFTVNNGDRLAAARLLVVGDDQYEVFLNGVRLGKRQGYRMAAAFDVLRFLQHGRNLLAISVANFGLVSSPAGLAARLDLEQANGEILEMATDETWLSSAVAFPGWQELGTDDSTWLKARQLGPIGMPPWGEVLQPGTPGQQSEKTRASGSRPNFLWLIAEDFGQHLGCFGTREVWTPNLDRMAREGVRYTRFFTTAPVCSPSRSAFMTGMYQTTIDAHNHRSHRDDGRRLPPGVMVLTDWLRAAGYFTANVRDLPPRCGFKGSAKTDWNFDYPGKPFDSGQWTDLKSNQPFYAQVNFQETHRPFRAPRRADPAKVLLPAWTPDHPVAREDWARYLDAATELDRKVGLVLEELAADGLADNTIVIFFGDNGMAHVRGKQFCYDEGLLVPLIIRWPKGIPPPKRWREGQVDDRLLEAIDLAPTMLAIAGEPKPAAMQGRVFLGPEAEQPRKFVFGARDRCDETVFRFRTVRDERYRYIRNFTPDRPFLQANEYKEKSYPVWSLLPQLAVDDKLTAAQRVLCAPTMPAEEFYDLKRDPEAVRNLALDPKQRKNLARLRTALERWIEESQDQGKDLEPPDLAARKGATRSGAPPNTGYTIDRP